ncbi:MAG: hypothetical protein QXL89_10035 [Nitrososphaeria archaeon]
MKSRRVELKILLDISFILPTLGIDVVKKLLRVLKKLANIGAEVYYSCFSILESLWVAVRLLERQTSILE